LDRSQVRSPVFQSRCDPGAGGAGLHACDHTRGCDRLPDGARAIGEPARRSLAHSAAQPAGARRHRARLHLGRIDPGRPPLAAGRANAAIAINKLPATVVTLREGTRALDAPLDEMAAVFAIPRGRAFRHVVLPQLAPYIAAASRSGLSLVWKIVLVAELLGRP